MFPRPSQIAGKRGLILLKPWQQAILVLFVLLGIALRFVALDRKPLWNDEAASLLYLTGHRMEELRHAGAQSSRPGLIWAQQAAAALRLSESTSGSPWHTVESLALEDPNHPPLYPLMTRAWVSVWGDSNPWVARAFSAALSLLLLPALFFLARELSPQLPLKGWIALSLAAVSPLHFLYAREIREYILWLLWIALSSLFLLRATRPAQSAAVLRKKRARWSWVAYGATVALGLYTFPLMIWVVAAQGIFMAVRARAFWRPWAGATGAAALLYLPWLVVLWKFRAQALEKTQWLTHQAPWHFYPRSWASSVFRVFFDPNFSWQHPLGLLILELLAILLCLGVVGWSLLSLRKSSRERTFLLCLAVSAFLPMIVMDAFDLGRRSIIPRYQLPLWLAVQLAVSLHLSRAWSSSKKLERQRAQVAWVALLILGAVSGYLNLRSRTWWNQERTPLRAEDLSWIEARQTERPGSVLITGKHRSSLLALSPRLPAQTWIALFPEQRTIRRLRPGETLLWLHPDPPDTIPGHQLAQWLRAVKDLDISELAPGVLKVEKRIRLQEAPAAPAPAPTQSERTPLRRSLREST